MSPVLLSKPCFSERAYSTPPCCAAKRTVRHGLRGVKPEGPGRRSDVLPARGTGKRLGAKAPGGSFALVSRINSNVPEPGKNGRYGAREDAHQAGHKLATGTTHGASHAPRSLIQEGENDSITDGMAGPKERSCLRCRCLRHQPLHLLAILLCHSHQNWIPNAANRHVANPTL